MSGELRDTKTDDQEPIIIPVKTGAWVEDLD